MRGIEVEGEEVRLDEEESEDDEEGGEEASLAGIDGIAEDVVGLSRAGEEMIVMSIF